MEVNGADCHDSPPPNNPSVPVGCSLSAGYTETHRLSRWPLCLCIRRLISNSAERCFEVGESVDRFWSLDLFPRSSKGSPAPQKLTLRCPELIQARLKSPKENLLLYKSEL